MKHALERSVQEEWNDAWTEETMNRFNQRKRRTFNTKRIVWLSAALLVFAVFAVSFVQQLFLTKNSTDYGLSGSSYSESGGLVASDSGSTSDTASSNGSTSGDADSSVPLSDSTFDPQKIIYSGSISLYTGDLQKTVTDIDAYVTSIGGFVENSSYSVNTDTTYSYDSYGSIQVRVPVDQYDAAMQTISNYGDVVYSYTNSQNVTQSYRDVESELASYRIQQARLNDLLAQATSVSDMLDIETELNRVRTEIDSRVSILENYDNLISYSTIYVSLYEQDISSVGIHSPFANLWQNIRAAFFKSINLFLTVIEKLILVVFYLLPFAVLAAAITGIVYALRKKKGLIAPKEKPQTKEDEKSEEADARDQSE